MKIKILKSGAKTGFLLLAGINRSVIPAQVSKLANSLNKMGCLRPIVIANITFLPVKGLYIIDGQHLFNALLRNDMDIPYVEIEIKDKQDLVEKIALLNASSRNWQLNDYVTAWSCINSDYAKLKDYFNIYDLEYCTLATVLMGRMIDGGNLSTRIKKGQFMIINESENRALLDYITDVLRSVPRGDRSQNKYVCREFITFYRGKGKSYIHAKFIEGLMKKQKSLQFVTQEPGKLVKLFETL